MKFFQSRSESDQNKHEETPSQMRRRMKKQFDESNRMDSLVLKPPPRVNPER